MIQLEALSKRYGKAQATVEALRGVDLDIRKGEIFGVIGRSGAGKSTLVRCVNLLERPDSGRVLIDGVDLTRLTATELRQQRREIGMIFQHFNLLSSRTVFDNVALPLEFAAVERREIEARVTPLLDLVGLTELRDRYPAQISGGQKQRVGIARALASQPKVLLSDEATSALDPETTRSILGLLQDINRQLGLSVVLITHQMQVVKQVCERVAVLAEGRIIESGDTFDVFTNPQSDVARAMIADVMRQNSPTDALDSLRPQLLSGAGRLWRLNFSGPSAGRPLLSELVRRFELEINILQGHVDEIRGIPFGSLLLFAGGRGECLEAALRWMRDQQLQLEEVPHVA
jgi:D-methionine transport system ATP-binding protein